MTKKINGKWILLISVFIEGIPIWFLSHIIALKNWTVSATLTLLLALSLTLLTKGQEKKIFFIVPAGLIIATIIKIIIDGISDPTSHNLWPFEIILLAIIGFAAALIGTGIGFVIKRFFIKSSKIVE